MESSRAVAALSALAHDGRLEIFRTLMRAGETGLPAGEVARACGILPQTLSASLTVLSTAGLVRSRRAGRSIIYAAAFDAMGDLLAFLVEDCCGGEPAICGPLAQVASRVCAAQERIC